MTAACGNAGGMKPTGPGIFGSAETTRRDVKWTGFRTAAVRDLAWLLRAPSLLSHDRFPDDLADPEDPKRFGPAAVADLSAVLTRLDAQPEWLMRQVSNGAERRLGRYAERLLHVWLHAAERLTPVATGLPVRDAGRTLGECDALFETPTGGYEHWELAVKFFLFIDDDDVDRSTASARSMPSAADQDDEGAPPSTAPSPRTSTAPPTTSTMSAPSASSPVPRAYQGCEAYVGAGLADRFDWKVRRLLEHQLPLSRHPALLALAPGPWHPSMLVKGRLFYPLARWRDRSRDPGAVAPDHVRGWWATLDTWRAWRISSACTWTTLARLEWLAPLCADAARACTGTAFDAVLTRHFGDGSNDPSRGEDWAADTPTGERRHAAGARAVPGAIQVAALMPYRSAGGSEGEGAGLTREVSRGFIVPNDWPERARRFRRAG